MDVLEFLDIVVPEHDRTSCNDERTENGWIKDVDDKGAIGHWSHRCRRCAALEIIRGDVKFILKENLKETF